MAAASFGDLAWVFLSVLGFMAAFLFNRTIFLGERVKTLDTEINNLRQQLAKTELDLKEALLSQENHLRDRMEQQDKDMRGHLTRAETTLAMAVSDLKTSLTAMAQSIELKVNALHKRLDTFLMDQTKPNKNGD